MTKNSLRGGLMALTLLLWMAPAALRKAPPPLLINLSASLPVGLYLRTRETVTVGTLVAACLPSPVASWARSRDYVGEGSRCPDSTRPVLKRVAAKQGATIDQVPLGLRVEDEPLPQSKPRLFDHQGRPMPFVLNYPYPVPEGHFLLMAGHPDSFDGRYFGPVEASSILGVYRPVWIWR